MSRSSSASIEDVSHQGAVRASCSSESAGTSSSDPNLLMLSGSQGSLGEMGNADENDDSLDLEFELRKIGIRFDCGNSQGPEDELCDNLLVILLMVIWKGVEGPHVQAWKVGALEVSLRSDDMFTKVRLRNLLYNSTRQSLSVNNHCDRFSKYYCFLP